MWTSDTARQGIDAALEATVVASWSRLGFAARRRLWSWADDERPTMEGRVVLVTGGTSGIGRAVVVAWPAPERPSAWSAGTRPE